MSGLPFSQILILMGILVISLSIHEFGHAFVANLGGDDTARLMGRMTLNPIAHIDPLWTLIVPAACLLLGGVWFGGAKPVPVVPAKLSRAWFLAAVSAGPISNLLLAIVFAAIGRVVGEGQVQSVCITAMAMNLLLAVFNLLPIHPLDGSRIWAAVVENRPAMLQGPGADVLGLMILVGLMQVGVIDRVVVAGAFVIFRGLQAVGL